VCPAGASHDASQSGHYATLFGDGVPGTQSGWRWCKKCQGFFFSLNPSKGVCPADHAAHDDSASGHYSLEFGDAIPGTQGLWRWCQKCQWLYFSGHPSVCPAGSAHDGSASGHYVVLWETDPCEPIRQEFLALEKQIQQIQSEPGYIQRPKDPHPGKPDPESLAEVKALWQKVAAKIAQWNACEVTLPGHKPDLSATFNGTATLTTSDSNAPGPFVQNISIGLLFHKFDHTTFDVTNRNTRCEGNDLASPLRNRLTLDKPESIKRRPASLAHPPLPAPSSLPVSGKRKSIRVPISTRWVSHFGTCLLAEHPFPDARSKRFERSNSKSCLWISSGSRTSQRK
jgi:hypothetical protein